MLIQFYLLTGQIVLQVDANSTVLKKAAMAWGTAWRTSRKDAAQGKSGEGVPAQGRWSGNEGCRRLPLRRGGGCAVATLAVLRGMDRRWIAAASSCDSPVVSRRGTVFFVSTHLVFSQIS